MSVLRGRWTAIPENGEDHVIVKTITLALALLVGFAAGASKPGANASPTADAAQAATAFLASLNDDARAKAQFAFESEERFNWHFVPRPRAGLPLKAMSAPQRSAAMDLLRAGLSEKGYTKSETIRGLEVLLAEIEQNPVTRDPDLYYVSIFGEPLADGTWGWRFEGHHISLNWTFVQGRSIAPTPQFFGSNPDAVRSGPRRDMRVLAAEQDLARALLENLSEAQRTQAIISAAAPPDIFSGNQRKAATLEERGIAFSDLTTEQRGLLLAIIEEYAGAQPEAVAEARLARLREAGLNRIRFAWMGGLARGEPHYYRLQGPTFLIEYDNTQNDANHIHA
ncbi:MAG: DUF3500 domain-containing protein, partial [Pseudomonadota bacterium]|nr:DUF3500 domain-containing protein [Pseudomonadota bacterium]